MADGKTALFGGMALVAVGKDANGKAAARALSPLRTAALFRDPSNDEEPYAVLTINAYPSDSGDRKIPGEATLYISRKLPFSRDPAL